MILSTETLYDIRKHSSKALKVADFLIKADQPLLFNKLTAFDKSSDEIDLVEAFHKDIEETTKKLEDTHMLLSTVDKEGFVRHLKEEKDLSKIFGDKYDKKTQQITFNFGVINLKKEFTREMAKSMILKRNLDMSIDQYTSMYKARKKLFIDDTEGKLIDDDSKIELICREVSKSQYATQIEKIKGYATEFHNFMKSQGIKNSATIANEITFVRTGVIGIIDSSTYITKENGIVQQAKGKTDEQETIDNIVKLVNENKYIEGVEIDKDANHQTAIPEIFNEINSLNLNLSSKVLLKFRKMGNLGRKHHKVIGSFYPDKNIIAIDLLKPSAVMHEFIHAIDINNDEILNSQVRKNFAYRMERHLDLSGFDTLDKKYYSDTQEIVSRAGEIAYIFNKFDFEPEKESINDFAKRVSEIQKKNLKNNLETKNSFNIVKSIDTYMENPNIYFNLKEMPKEDLIAIKDYYKMYFRKPGQENLLRVEEVDMPLHIPHKVVGVRHSYIMKSVGLITKENIREVFDYNEKHKIIEPDALILKILSNPASLDRTSEAFPNGELQKKIEIIRTLCDYIIEKDDLIMLSKLADARMLLDRNINVTPYLIAKHVQKGNNFNSDINDYAEEFINRNRPIYNEYKELKTTSNGYSEKIKTLRENYYAVAEETILKPINGFNKFTSEIEGYNDLMVMRENVRRSKKNYTLFDSSLSRIYSPVDKAVQEMYEKHGSEIFLYFKKDSVFPVATALEIGKINPSISSLQKNYNEHRYNVKGDIQPYFKDKNLMAIIDPELYSAEEKSVYLKTNKRLLASCVGHKNYATINNFNIFETEYKDDKRMFIPEVINMNNLLTIPLTRFLKVPQDHNIKESIDNIMKESGFSMAKYEKIQNQVKKFEDSYKIENIQKVSVKEKIVVESTKKVGVEENVLTNKIESTSKKSKVDSNEKPNKKPIDINKESQLISKNKRYNPNQGNLF